MYFTKVRLYASATSQVDLPQVGALPTDPYNLRGITGLEPPDVANFIADTMQGGYFAGADPANRQIVITVGLNPNWAAGQTVSDLRTALYGMLANLNTAVAILIMNGASVVAEVDAYLSKFDIDIYSKDPAVTLTFDATSPYLHAYTSTVLNPTPVGSQASFTNPGSATSGFLATFTITAADANGFALTDQNGTVFSVSGSFNAGDIISINTIYGQRAVTQNRGGTITSLLDRVTITGPDWPVVAPGANIIKLQTATLAALTYTWTSITYTAQYWGI